MIKKSITIQLSIGLEARPIAMVVQTASKFNSSIYLEFQNKKINAKSIMGMMSLSVLNGDSIDLVVDGEDEDAALKEMEGYLSGK